MYEVRGLKEWGLIADYWQYKRLPEPVLTAWRLCASAESQAHADRLRAAQTQAEA